MSGGFGKSKEKGRSRVEIPDFMEPFLRRSVVTGQHALDELVGPLGYGEARHLISPFNDAQRQAQELAMRRAGGEGGFFPAAQETFLDTARGTPLSDILPQSAFQKLTGISQGQALSNFMPADALTTLLQGSRGMSIGGMDNLERLQNQRLPGQVTNTLSQFANQSSLPGQARGTLGQLARNDTLPGQSRATLGQLARNDTLPGQSRAALAQFAQESGLPPEAMDTLSQLMGDRDVQGTDTLSNLTGQQAVPEETLAALRSTAGGDHLFGGEGFQAAVDAAVRAAQPHILSTFGRAGRGTGGLAETAIAQSGIDAFARQHAQERQNQLRAAGMLGEFGLSERGQTADIASRLAGLDLAEVDQQSGIAAQLANLGLAGADQQIGAATNLGRLGLAAGDQRRAAASDLGQLGLAAGNQRLSAASDLGRLGLEAGNQQIGAAQALGDLNLADRGMSADISQALATLGLNRNAQRLGAAESLAGFSSAERDRSLSAAGLLSDLATQERTNQLDAARRLPQLATEDINLMMQVGQQRQDQAQRELRAPIDARLQLLAASLGILPTESLLGRRTSGRSSNFGLRFGPPAQQQQGQG